MYAISFFFINNARTIEFCYTYDNTNGHLFSIRIFIYIVLCRDLLFFPLVHLLHVLYRYIFTENKTHFIKFIFPTDFVWAKKSVLVLLNSWKTLTFAMK